MPLMVATLRLLSKDQGEIMFWEGCLGEFCYRRDVARFFGLYARRPWADDNSVDNYIAISSASFVRSCFIRNYAENNHWCFNLKEPGKFIFHDWYGRFIGFPPYIRMRSKVPHFFDHILFSIACMASLFCKKTDVSNLILQWIMNSTIEECKLPKKLWAWIAMKRWPGGMKEVFSYYHGKDHPFVKYAQSHFA